ncbi:helix-turn-helix domain-containing protein [Streptomyces sp. NPDC015680]|uniref:helix-turn-helix domain-containing protein n=1 Tax=Streptomyces sp. NPDC015680 TaxID=3364962 RepID=UPI0036FA6CA5
MRVAPRRTGSRPCPAGSGQSHRRSPRPRSWASPLTPDRPARPWTVATLAAKVGSSRSGLARRFTQHVGEPPKTYLAALRIGLAAELLHETDATVGSIARKAGYSNASPSAWPSSAATESPPPRAPCRCPAYPRDAFLTKVGQCIGDTVRAWRRRQETASTTHPGS